MGLYGQQKGTRTIGVHNMTDEQRTRIEARARAMREALAELELSCRAMASHVVEADMDDVQGAWEDLFEEMGR